MKSRPSHKYCAPCNQSEAQQHQAEGAEEGRALRSTEMSVLGLVDCVTQACMRCLLENHLALIQEWPVGENLQLFKARLQG